MIKAVIFDLDGTIIDTLKGLSYSCNLALEKMGFPPISTHTYKTLIGCGADKLMEDMLLTQKHSADKDSVAQLKEYFNQFYKDNLLYKAKPYYGVEKMLDSLKNMGLKLGVLSNKPDIHTQRMIAALLPGIFDVVYGKKDELPRKPDPAGALAEAAELGVLPGECLYVGDSGVDMQTASAAQMLPMGVLWGFREKKELIQNGARFLADKPSDIPTLINVIKKIGA